MVAMQWKDYEPFRFLDNDNNNNDNNDDSSSSSRRTLPILDSVVPPLSVTSHKGSAGRIVVVGGSPLYTGAPYYAAMASLSVGADLATVLCAEEASIPIKSYSPELMVAPVYQAHQFNQQESTAENQQDALVHDTLHQLQQYTARAHCIVLGPGLGRDPLVMKAVAMYIKWLQSERPQIPLVLDADALFVLAQPAYRRTLLSSQQTNIMAPVVLTPNSVEYKRLFPDNDNNNNNRSVALGDHVWIIRKGHTDEIFRANSTTTTPTTPVYSCTEPGGLKRSGGLGDVLAGTVATLVTWHTLLQSSHTSTSTSTDIGFSLWMACCVVKRATRYAFAAKHRAMTAPDVLNQLGVAVHHMTTTNNNNNNDDDEPEAPMANL